jgi:hypothetical protein
VSDRFRLDLRRLRYGYPVEGPTGLLEKRRPFEGAQSRCAADFLREIMNRKVLSRESAQEKSRGFQSEGPDSITSSSVLCEKTNRLSKSYCVIKICRYDVHWIDLMDYLQSSRRISTVTKGALARLATLGFEMERRWRYRTSQCLWFLGQVGDMKTLEDTHFARSYSSKIIEGTHLEGRKTALIFEKSSKVLISRKILMQHM